MEHNKKLREALEFLEKINPSFKNQDITKINTFGGEFLIYCVQKAFEKKLLEDAIDKVVKATKLSNLRDEKDLDNVIDTLEKFNQYRRDKNIPSKVKMVSPKELGEAIDKAIEILKTLKP